MGVNIFLWHIVILPCIPKISICTHRIFRHCKFRQYQPGGEMVSFLCDSGKKLEVLSFLLIPQDLGTHRLPLYKTLKSPKGACQLHCLQPAITPGHQAPVRPHPKPWRRKLRTSCFLESEHKKETISPPGVPLPIPPAATNSANQNFPPPPPCVAPDDDVCVLEPPGYSAWPLTELSVSFGLSLRTTFRYKNKSFSFVSFMLPSST